MRSEEPERELVAVVYVPLYRPGVRGWWAHLRLWDALRDGDGIRWRQIWRRGRISARLRQSEQERAYWERQACA
jgi:hypothetical protein